MGLFGKKREEVVDWTEGYKRQRAKVAEKKVETQEQEKTSSAFGFFGNFNRDNQSDSIPAVSSSSESESENLSEDEKRRRLARRFLNITNKMEDLSNQIYHLQQRIELLEKKVGVKSSEDLF
ncbi:MAG: hypothetical protein Q7S06_01065 [Nanoarchaeota archaeon]|nr:hypothetical protein [Nanoarchaeota archaeon]